MALEEEYPKTCRRRTGRVLRLLEEDATPSNEEREEIAMAISAMADKARDLDEIVDRLLNEQHTPAEVGELLIAFELTTEQLRGHSETIDGKLYEIGDRLKALKPAKKVKHGALKIR